ncbi:MAG: LemA family protein [Bacilli bacterium]|nr:LemA family protein [Bacilli bacterium]
MANDLDELTGPVNDQGRDVNVINKQIPVTVGVGSKVFEVALWVMLVIPGLIFQLKKVKAGNYFDQLQQKLQHDASTIDNYLEQRVMILQNAAKILDKAIDLDKTTFAEIAKNRNGGNFTQASQQIDNVERAINVAMEAYPDLKAHAAIQDAMQQNNYLQREITAAREVYNNTVNQWNKDIFKWPVKQIVAAKRGYTTRIPFTTTKEIKEKARDVFF